MQLQGTFMLRIITSLAVSVSVLFAVIASSLATSSPIFAQTAAVEAPSVTLTLG
jgi:hypothetical protein